MKIRKTLVVCPESRRSEIVAVLFPSSTSFPETKTLKRIKKKENVPGISRLQVFLSRNVQTFPQWSFLEGCKNIARMFVLRSPSACSSLYLSISWIFFFLKTISYFWKDAKRERTLPGCLFLGHRLLFHLCICLSWIFFFLKTILYFWRDAKRRERTLPGCLSSGHPLLLPLFILLQGKVRFVSRLDLAKKWRQGHPGPFS